jgi:hypothetical protein
MNKLPDQTPRPAFSDERFEDDLTREERIQGGTLGQDPELSADRSLKDVLSRIETPALPTELRERILQRSTRASFHTVTWFAMAATVVLSVVVALALNPFPQRGEPADISQEDWNQLVLAIETLNQSGEQIAQVTQRGVTPHLDLSRFELPRLELQLDPLPTPGSFRRWFQPSVPQKQ